MDVGQVTRPWPYSRARVAALREQAERDEYEKLMGRPPPEPVTDHPLAWQWSYKGTKQDRERLAALLSTRR